MRRPWIVALALIGSSAVAQRTPPEIPFESVPNVLRLPPDMNLGEATGVAVNSRGHVFVFTRSNSASGPAFGASAAQLLEFGPDGAFLREIGKGLYAWSYAHAVRVDREDNIWCVDKGSDMVVKFNPDGHVAMVFGRKKEASDEAAPWTRVTPPRLPIDGYFRQPTDVTLNAQGDIFISDGYINSRIAKYDRNGDWVKSWARARRARKGRQEAQAVRLGARDRVSGRERAVRRGAAQLAGAEADSSPGQGHGGPVAIGPRRMIGGSWRKPRTRFAPSRP